ncbi:MAG: HlyD family type I secretion periplasmic adaptor subunit [Pseudomonadales bacterium]|nr:HlyD family type I secretion periplasmic adaptor subunit [Pseudomonadales bacterium]
MTPSSNYTVKFSDADKRVGRTQIIAGYSIIAVFFSCVFAWSALAPISSAAVAKGVVGKDGHRKTVQHLEGGIINEILVRDGDRVTRGQPLITLRDVQNKSDHELLNKQRLIALAKQSSLVAELEQREPDLNFLPAGKTFEVIDASVRTTIEGYLSAAKSRLQLHRDQLDLIDRRQKQAEEKIAALRSERTALEKQRRVLAQEHKKYKEFEAKGLVTRAHVFSLQRDKTEIESDHSANRVAVENTRQEINNLAMEKSELEGARAKRISNELDKTRSTLVDLDERLSKTRDRLERTSIQAPIDGVVVNLLVNTIGGVIQPGEALLDIVPDSGDLVIDARVKVADRDTIRVGQPAEVRFTAFNQRLTAPVTGTVKLISADALSNSGPGGLHDSYYKATIKLDEDPASVLGEGSVYPGMQADVMIVTGKRTALEYFLKPITRSFQRSFRDE